jgi:hypothetical protein
VAAAATVPLIRLDPAITVARAAVVVNIVIATVVLGNASAVVVATAGVVGAVV